MENIVYCKGEWRGEYSEIGSGEDNVVKVVSRR